MKWRKILNNAVKYRERQWNVKKCREMHGNEEKCREVQWMGEKYREILRNIKKLTKNLSNRILGKDKDVLPFLFWWIFFIFYPFQIVYLSFSAFSSYWKSRYGNGMMRGYQIMIWILIIFCSVEYQLFSVLSKLYTFIFICFQIIKL